MDHFVADREFGLYAEAQAAYGRHLLKLHRRDGTGCCRGCGRAHPCDERVHAGRLLAHFAHWSIDSV
ncbi:hypothetical protein [Catellatospora sp. NPDC049609]|uniref:hypothetical protein n=1 Tax=Catellatospora sp. NPDC049609 TaxID=3155505 RepID=UPI0034219DAA